VWGGVVAAAAVADDDAPAEVSRGFPARLLPLFFFFEAM
jgi:hypothetical protein